MDGFAQVFQVETCSAAKVNPDCIFWKIDVLEEKVSSMEQSLPEGIIVGGLVGIKVFQTQLVG